MSNKRIIFCSTSFYEYDRRIQRIIKTLLQENYDITWISRSINANLNPDSKIENKIIDTVFKRGILFYLEFNMRLFFKLIFTQGRYVCLNDADTLMGGYWASLLSFKKVIFDSHEIFHEVPELSDKSFKKAIWKSVFSWGSSFIKYKYTVNKALQDIFKSEFGLSFSVIRNVPVRNEVKIKPKLDNKILVYLGAVNLGRGVEVAIQSLTKLSDYNLWVIGDGDLIDKYKHLVSKLELNDRVKFFGYTSPEVLFSLLEKCSIGLNLLDPSSGNYKNSLANKFFDYMHAELPIVSMNFIEYAHLNAQYKVAELIENYETKDLVNAVSKIEMQDNYSRLQANCAEAKDVFNWEKESQKLIAIYNQFTL